MHDTMNLLDLSGLEPLERSVSESPKITIQSTPRKPSEQASPEVWIGTPTSPIIRTRAMSTPTSRPEKRILLQRKVHTAPKKRVSLSQLRQDALQKWLGYTPYRTKTKKYSPSTRFEEFMKNAGTYATSYDRVKTIVLPPEASWDSISFQAVPMI